MRIRQKVTKGGNMSKIPVFSLEDSSKENFDKYNAFMSKEQEKGDVNKCRYVFDAYLKAMNIKERERKRADALLDKEEPVTFGVE